MQTPSHLAWKEAAGRCRRAASEGAKSLISGYLKKKFQWLGALMEHISNHHLFNESANLCLLAPHWHVLNCLEMR